jgi:hypothetical protein
MPPLLGQGRKAAHEQHPHQAGNILLKTYRTENNGEIGQRPGGLNRKGSLVVLRQKDSLTHQVGTPVNQIINQLQAQIGHADAVGIGKEQPHRQPPLPILLPGTSFAGKIIIGGGPAMAHYDIFYKGLKRQAKAKCWTAKGSATVNSHSGG